jgi:hypothetical protein
MKRLDDGRWLMASYADIRGFFERHSIVGRTISDIRPAALDYMIQNLEDLDDIETREGPCAIDTDSQICLIFGDGDHIEIEFSGDGPVILGYNTADLAHYPEFNGYCYKLSTMFHYCLGQRIVDISFVNSSRKMLFPAYKGIDMSGEDDGIKAIRFNLEDGSALIASGNVDWFSLEHRNKKGEYVTVALKDLLNELLEWPPFEMEEDEDDEWEEERINIGEDEEFLFTSHAISELLLYYCEKYHDPETVEYKDQVIKALEDYAADEMAEDFSFSISYRSGNEIRYFSFSLSGDELSMSDAGHVYTPEVGGDSYTNWMFTIWKDGSRDGSAWNLDKSVVKELIDSGAELCIDS